MTESVLDTVTLAMDGEVSLDDFATAMDHFRGLVQALTDELADGNAVRWVIDQLMAGSALATARGIPTHDSARKRLAAVVSGYLEVGRSLEHRRPVPFSPSVGRAAAGLATLLPRVESIRFETPEDEAIVAGGLTEPAGEGQLAFEVHRTTERRRPAYGAVRGRVQTLSSRGQLRFTLYDALNNRAVSCYLAEGQQDLMRSAWDQMAIVEGLVTRDASGRPLSVRQVREVRILAESGPKDYLMARGAIPIPPDAPRPEEIIRRLRDAG